MDPENQPTAPQPSGNESGLIGGGAGLDDDSGATGGGIGRDDESGLTSGGVGRDDESGLTSGSVGRDDESGATGGGIGRDDDAGLTGDSPASADTDPSGDAPAQREEAWGQGQRGAARYQDSGGSGLEANSEADTQPGTSPRSVML